MSDQTTPAPLAGQHAFITDGGSGIGLDTARELVADGAKVAIAGRTAETLDAAVAKLGPDAVSTVLDDDHHLRRGPNIDTLLAPHIPDLPPASAPARTPAEEEAR